jgi:hypothetical protein
MHPHVLEQIGQCFAAVWSMNRIVRSRSFLKSRIGNWLFSSSRESCLSSYSRCASCKRDCPTRSHVNTIHHLLYRGHVFWIICSPPKTGLLCTLAVYAPSTPKLGTVSCLFGPWPHDENWGHAHVQVAYTASPPPPRLICIAKIILTQSFHPISCHCTAGTSSPCNTFNPWLHYHSAIWLTERSLYPQPNIFL